MSDERPFLNEWDRVLDGGNRAPAPPVLPLEDHLEQLGDLLGGGERSQMRIDPAVMEGWQENWEAEQADLAENIEGDREEVEEEILENEARIDDDDVDDDDDNREVDIEFEDVEVEEDEEELGLTDEDEEDDEDEEESEDDGEQEEDDEKGDDDDDDRGGEVVVEQQKTLEESEREFLESARHSKIENFEQLAESLSRIGSHRVVATKLALIGDSREAITSAGSITTRLLGNFQNIEHVFIVGVGGAVPHFMDASLHARLGDVIVSASRPHQYVYAHDLLVDRITEQITGFAIRNWDSEDKTIERIVETGGQELVNSWNSDNRQGGAEIHLGTVGAMSAMKKYENAIGGEEEKLGKDYRSTMTRLVQLSLKENNNDLAGHVDSEPSDPRRHFLNV